MSKTATFTSAIKALSTAREIVCDLPGCNAQHKALGVMMAELAKMAPEGSVTDAGAVEALNGLKAPEPKQASPKATGLDGMSVQQLIAEGKRLKVQGIGLAFNWKAGTLKAKVGEALKAESEALKQASIEAKALKNAEPAKPAIVVEPEVKKAAQPQKEATVNTTDVMAKAHKDLAGWVKYEKADQAGKDALARAWHKEVILAKGWGYPWMQRMESRVMADVIRAYPEHKPEVIVAQNKAMPSAESRTKPEVKVEPTVKPAAPVVVEQPKPEPEPKPLPRVNCKTCKLPHYAHELTNGNCGSCVEFHKPKAGDWMDGLVQAIVDIKDERVQALALAMADAVSQLIEQGGVGPVTAAAIVKGLKEQK